MVEENTIITKFESVLAELKKSETSISLFAALKMDDIVDSWSIIISSPTIETTEDRRRIFKTTIDCLVSKLASDELNDITRVGVFPESEHLVSDLLKYKKGHITTGFRANGNFIHEAYIFESKGEFNVEKTL